MWCAWWRRTTPANGWIFCCSDAPFTFSGSVYNYTAAAGGVHTVSWSIDQQFIHCLHWVIWRHQVVEILWTVCSVLWYLSTKCPLSSLTLIGTRPGTTSLMRSWKRESPFLWGVRCFVCVVSLSSAGTFRMNVRLSNYIDISTLNKDNSVKLLNEISNILIAIWIRFSPSPGCLSGNLFFNKVTDFTDAV